MPVSDGWDRVHREIQATRDRLRQGLADPDAFFAERGFELGCYEADGEWWCDLGPSRGASALRRYGSGESLVTCKESAVHRWVTEQESSDLERRPGDRLP